MKHFVLFFIANIFIWCVGCSGDAKTETKKTIPVQQKVEQEPLHPLLQQVLPQCNVVELVFFVKGMAMSTETRGANAINSFYTYIEPNELVRKPDCNYDNFEGGAVFRSPAGDIKMTLDFVVQNKACQFVKVIIDKKTYYKNLNEAGVRYFNQFMNLRPENMQGQK